MPTICIIDDQKEYLDIAEKEILKHYQNCEIIKLTEYNYRILEDKIINLFILDINMKGINGIDLALLLKEKYPYVEFVFLSAYNNLVHDTLQVRPLYFIRKDHLEKDFKMLFKMLDLNKYQQKIILTDCEKIKRTIIIDNIVYVEINSHYLTVFLENNQFTFYLSLKQFIEKVFDNNLVQIHKSYIVNIKKIDYIKGNECFMLGNISLPIGRKYRLKFIDLYRNSL